MKCNSCQSDLPVLQDGKKGGYCVNCGIPFTVSETGAQVFDESTLDKIAEKVVDTMEAREEAKRKARKKAKADDDETDDEKAERKRKEKADDQYSQ